MSIILDEAEIERLIAERANLQIQRDAVMDRMDGVDGTLCGLQFQLDAVAARIDEIDRALAIGLLEAVDRRITPEHVAARFGELLDDIGDDNEGGNQP
jgi:hypothetical protein